MTIRPAVYAPDSSYSEAATSAMAALFPEDIDPVLAKRLTQRAFSRPPAIFGGDEDIIVADYRAGPSACAADMETDFLIGLLAHAAQLRAALLHRDDLLDVLHVLFELLQLRQHRLPLLHRYGQSGQPAAYP